MIDFSKTTDLSDPIGKIVQVADAAGNVLWSAVKKAIITVTGTTIGYAEYNGVQYQAPSTFEAVVGDKITVFCGYVPSAASIWLNGTQVSSGVGATTYQYAVVGDANINVVRSGSGTSTRARIDITEQ